ncbi:hypothetical protein G6F57_019759 [Rhizopus arrhizus]|nr:hypothetical protein G6F57_019759 [Rhizopus arrhizus]
MAREAGAHAGGRHHLGQAFAHHQILGVPFREFVHVGACHQFVPMALERRHRQLDEVNTRQQIVVVLEFQRVQHVFAVMQDDARKRHRLLLVLREDGLHDPVQAVRLAGGPVMGHLHADQLPIAPAHPFHFVDRPLVVLVRAGEDHVVLVFQRRHHRFQHRRDHVVLQPRGHHDRQRLFLLGAQLLGRQRGVAALDRSRAG